MQQDYLCCAMVDVSHNLGQPPYPTIIRPYDTAFPTNPPRYGATQIASILLFRASKCKRQGCDSPLCP